MHDDQHGTAIISAAALINALELCGKKIEDVRIIINGAGAAAISCGKLYISLGAKQENIVMLDSKGVIRADHEITDHNKKHFATALDLNSLDDAMVNSDVFIGLSKGNVLSRSMVASMNAQPIVFALANPEPEINYEDAMAARKDLIFATGRSDYPNQVNNAIGFPFIFRGALDVRATQINEAMKLAAVYAIAELAKETVPEIVNIAYNKKNLSFGREYIIPKPLDPRLISTVAPAVAKAAIKSGVAQTRIANWEQYAEELDARIGRDDKLSKVLISLAKQNPQRVVFGEAENYKMLKAAQIVNDEGIAKPILLGNKQKIDKLIKENNLHLGDIVVIDPSEDETYHQQFGEALYEKRQRKGLTIYN